MLTNKIKVIQKKVSANFDFDGLLLFSHSSSIDATIIILKQCLTIGE